LVATHYLELTQLEDEFGQIKNYHMAISKREEGINFLYTLKRGKAEGSFGIYVASKAGLPQEIIQRSYQILASFDKSLPLLEKVYQDSKKMEEEEVYKEIRKIVEKIDLANTTPLQALLILAEIKEKLSSSPLPKPLSD